VASAEELGERKIIKLIQGCLEPMSDMPLSFGDDASALDIGNNNLIVVNTDMLVAKTDVPKQMTLWQAARKAAVMTISDLAAKGTQPKILLASIGVPPYLTKNNIQQIGKGLNAGTREYGAYLIGGDTNEAPDTIINCVALGTCKKQHLIKRNGAKAGDILAVTGTFGKTSAGLKILIENLEATQHKQQLIDSILMPKAHLKEGIALAHSGAATASIDVSDGLAWSIHELSKASNTGFKLDNIPVAPEAKQFAKYHNLNPIELALYGGEEYEILAAIKPRLWQKAKKAVQDAGGDLIKIGTATKEAGVFLKKGDETLRVDPRGWEHFKTN
jgi:thiamine-monophosphate kinase